MRRTKPAPPAPERTVEPVEPGGEIGETRETAPRSSAERLTGRPPRTRVQIRAETDDPGDR